MKKLLILLACSITLASCKNDTKKTDSETVNVDTTLSTIEGEYIYIADAAVLKGASFIYGVVLDDKAAELAEKIAPMKKEPYDMVPVIIKGIIKKNPEKEGWEEVVEIKEIVEVLSINTENAPQEDLNVNVTQ